MAALFEPFYQLKRFFDRFQGWRDPLHESADIRLGQPRSCRGVPDGLFQFKRSAIEFEPVRVADDLAASLYAVVRIREYSSDECIGVPLQNNAAQIENDVEGVRSQFSEAAKSCSRFTILP